MADDAPRRYRDNLQGEADGAGYIARNSPRRDRRGSDVRGSRRWREFALCRIA
jgi:hypothetical protein